MMHTCPPEHIHDRTVTCYKTHGCRCDPCRARATKAAREHTARQRAGHEHYAPIGPFVNHILTLTDAGMSQKDIARRSGVSEVTISRVVRGKQTRIYTSTARAVLAVQPRESVQSGGVIDGLGTRRRLGALTALGYTTTELSAMLGRKRGAVSLILHSENVTPKTRDQVVELFTRLAMTVPPESAAAKRSRTFAKRNGWVPPLAWDSIDTDPEPADKGVDRGRGWVVDELEHLRSLGESADSAAVILAEKPSTMAALAYRHGRPDVARWIERADREGQKAS